LGDADGACDGACESLVVGVRAMVCMMWEMDMFISVDIEGQYWDSS
jgi:hypothetical protein